MQRQLQIVFLLATTALADDACSYDKVGDALGKLLDGGPDVKLKLHTASQKISLFDLGNFTQLSIYTEDINPTWITTRNLAVNETSSYIITVLDKMATQWGLKMEVDLATSGLDCIHRFHMAEHNLSVTNCTTLGLVSDMQDLLRSIASSASKESRQKSCIKNPFSSYNDEWERCVCSYRRKLSVIVEIALNDFLDDRYFPKSLETPVSYTHKVIDRMVFVLEVQFNALVNVLRELTLKYHEGREPLTILNVHYRSELIYIELLSFDGDSGSGISSTDRLSWGIIRSRAGFVEDACARFYATVSDPDKFQRYSLGCLLAKTLRAVNRLVNCTNWISDDPEVPLAWEERSVFFDTACLCVLSQRADCGGGVQTTLQHCRLELLRDLRRHVTYRPAITYLDYTLKKRLSLATFTLVFLSQFDDQCRHLSNDDKDKETVVKEGLCFFDGLVNMRLNCSGTSADLKTFNNTTLCVVQYYLKFIVAHTPANERSFWIYGYGHSPVTIIFTTADVIMRVATLVIYVTFREMRNLPGKLFVFYQATALLDIILMKYIFAYKNNIIQQYIVVYIDIYLDLACTCSLSAMSHFFYLSVKSLTPPNDLSKSKIRNTLFKYSSYIWGFPAITLVSCVYTDRHVHSRSQYGQLVVVLTSFLILLANVAMFLINFRRYYSIKKDVRHIRKGTTTKSHYTDLLFFSVKTLVLSGVGIIVRITLTQLENFETLLNYFYILSTFQGIVIFCMFACTKKIRLWLKQKVLTLCHGQG